MQDLNLIAELLGFSLITIPLAAILNRNILERMIQLMTNELVLFYGGIFNFIIGLAIVLGYHSWIYNWQQVIIMIIGWLAVLEGLFYMFFPSVASKLMAKIKVGKGIIIYLTILILLGIFLVFVG